MRLNPELERIVEGALAAYADRPLRNVFRDLAMRAYFAGRMDERNAASELSEMD